MKALAMGTIPITSRYVNSTLPELTKQWDLGPEGHTGKKRQGIVWRVLAGRAGVGRVWIDGVICSFISGKSLLMC